MSVDKYRTHLAAGEFFHTPSKVKLSENFALYLGQVEGEHVYRYGQIIGISSQDICSGEHVHSHNLTFSEFDRNYDNDFSTSLTNLKKSDIYFQGYMICSVDGVHHFSSEKVHCKSCMKYTKSNGVLEYRHYLLSGSIVHPDKKEVMPVIHEPILRVDGQEKNDCERNAGKRLLPKLRKLFPKEKLIIVEDALSSNGPHIKALQAEKKDLLLVYTPEEERVKVIDEKIKDEMVKEFINFYGKNILEGLIFLL